MSCNSPSLTNTGAGFPNAASMAQLATNYSVVWEEICAIQQAVLAAASQCQPGGGTMCTTVGGTTPMTFVSGLTSVTIIDGGFGYAIDKPTVEFIPPNGAAPAFLATADVITNGSAITNIVITNGGSGYLPVPATLTVSTVGGVGAQLVPLVDAAGTIQNVGISNPGLGYTLGDIVIAHRAVLPNIAYVDAVFQITSVGLLGEILDVAVLNPGSGYQDSVTTLRIVSALSPADPYPLGSGMTANVLVNSLGIIYGVLITNSGQGYANFNPYLVISDSGIGAETSVVIDTPGGGIVTAINVVKSGTNYTQLAAGFVFNPPTAPLPNPPTFAANVKLNVSQNTYGTNPQLYYQVWSGTVTNKPIQMQMSQVISYFQSLGYTIIIQSNPNNPSTIQWKICW